MVSALRDLPDVPDVPETLTLAAACRVLRVDPKTLRQWCAKAGIVPVPDRELAAEGTSDRAWDGRIKRLTREQVERLARRHGRLLTPLRPLRDVRDVRDVRPLPDPSSLLTAARTPRTPTAPVAPVAPTVPAVPASYAPPARALARAAEADLPSLLEPSAAHATGTRVRLIPYEWVPFNTLLRDHGLYRADVLRAIADGHLPAYRTPPAGEEWFRLDAAGHKRGRALTALYSPQEHAQVCAVARVLWPRSYRAPCDPAICPDQGDQGDQLMREPGDAPQEA